MSIRTSNRCVSAKTEPPLTVSGTGLPARARAWFCGVRLSVVWLTIFPISFYADGLKIT